MLDVASELVAAIMICKLASMFQVTSMAGDQFDSLVIGSQEGKMVVDDHNHK